MNYDEKYQEMLDFCRKLNPNQKIIFSDSRNLYSKDNIDNVEQTYRYKPYGLWYGFGGVWVSWLTNGFKDCSVLNYHDRWGRVTTENYNEVYRVYLDYSKIYKISTISELIRFNNRYRKTREANEINWDDVLDNGYLGIQIKWMGNTAADNFPWYDSWDVSSGCIWGKDAIKELKLLKKWEVNWTKIK